MVIPVQTTTACFLWLLGRFQERVTGADIRALFPRADSVAWSGRYSFGIRKCGWFLFKESEIGIKNTGLTVIEHSGHRSF
jgi:hypothetical protein